MFARTPDVCVTIPDKESGSEEITLAGTVHQIVMAKHLIRDEIDSFLRTQVIIEDAQTRMSV